MLIATPILVAAVALPPQTSAVEPAAVAPPGEGPATAPAAPPPIVVPGAAWGSTPAWNADGRFLLYARALEPGQTDGEIRAIEVATGTDRSLGRVAYPAHARKGADGIGGDVSDGIDDPAAARAAKVLHPRAASADLSLVWLDQQGEGLWSWRPADGRLARRDSPARDDDLGFQLSAVAACGPEGRLAVIDSRGRVGICAAADTVDWFVVPTLAGHGLGAVAWWRDQLMEVMPDGHARILWPTSPAMPAPVFAADPHADAADLAAPLRGRDLSSGDQLTASIAGNEEQTLAGLHSTSTVLALHDQTGAVRWTRALDWSATQARVRAEVMKAEIPPGQPQQQRYRQVWEEASVIAYHHPHALLRLSICGWYGMDGRRVHALLAYECDTRRLTALSGDVYQAGSGGLTFDRGGLPECAADPAATAVAFRQGDRITVLRAPAAR
jgi:hypothetical protein